MDDSSKVEVLDLTDEKVMVQVLKYFTTQAQIEALEEELLSCQQTVIPVKHSFCKGIYARQITIPKGSLAIGHEHSEDCLNIVVSGSVSVVIDGEVKLVKGPACFVSPANQRKIGYVHEDLTWITVHPTKETDIKTVEAKLIIKSDAFRRYELTSGDECTSIATCKKDEYWEDRIDYFKMLSEAGITHAEAREMTEDLRDQIDFPPGKGDGVYVGTSPIEGNGLFSAFDAAEGDVLALARVGSKRTPAGRYVNHSARPNCKYTVGRNGDIHLVATQVIKKDEELTVDYRQAITAAKEAAEINQLLTLN